MHLTSAQANRSAGLVAAVLVLAGTAACAPTTAGEDTSAASPSGSTSAGPAEFPDEITVIQRATIDGLQPDVTTARMSMRVAAMVLDPLVRYAWDGEKYEIVPALAESWEQTDPTHWRVTLRSGVTFTNGEPVTSAAVESTLAAYIENGRGGGSAQQGISIEPVNDLEFDIVTDVENLQSVPDKMSVLWVYPPEYYAEVGPDAFSSAPIGTGPYVVDEFDPGLGVTLTANEDHWAGAPPIDTIEIRTVADDSTRVAELEAGTADFITDVPPNLVDRVEALDGVTLKEVTSQRRVFAFITPTSAPTDDVLVRQAINHAINKEAIVESIFAGHASVLSGVWLPGEIGYDPDFAGYEYDPEQARDLLAQAGYPDGLEIDFHYPIAYTPSDQQVAEAIQGQLAEVGITARMDGGPVTAISDKIREGINGMTLYSFAPFYNGPSFLGTVAYFSDTAAFAPYAPDPSVHELSAAGLVEPDPAAAEQIYTDLESRVTELAYWLPLYGLNDIYAMSDELAGWMPRPDQNYEFQDIQAP